MPSCKLKQPLPHFRCFLTIVFLVSTIHGQADSSRVNRRLFITDIAGDLRHFYSLRTQTVWTLALAGSAIFSFTPIDKSIKDAFQENIRGPRSDAVAKMVKPFGNWQYSFPIYTCCSLLDYFQWENQPQFLYNIGNWGTRSSRALFLGFPYMVIFQRLIGSGRPATDNSKWLPFQNASGLSGHAYVGAVPFLAAASMTDNPWVKGLFITASTATAISRINDNKHYTSQTVLGWLLAWLSVRAVSRSEDKNNPRSLSFIFTGNGIDAVFTF